MPVDPRLWAEGPIRSTYPACMAVKAAAEQGAAAGRRATCARARGDHVLSPQARRSRGPDRGGARGRARRGALSPRPRRRTRSSRRSASDLERTRALDAGRVTLPGFEVGDRSCSPGPRPRGAARARRSPRAASRRREPALGRDRRAGALRSHGRRRGGGGVWPTRTAGQRRAVAPGRRMASEAGASADRNALGASLELDSLFEQPSARCPDAAHPASGSPNRVPTPRVVVPADEPRRPGAGRPGWRSPRPPARPGTTQQNPQPMLNTSCISSGPTDPRSAISVKIAARGAAVDQVADLGLEAQQIEEALAGDVGKPAHLDVGLEQLPHRADVDQRGLEQALVAVARARGGPR